jgi:hypothetical protein
MPARDNCRRLTKSPDFPAEGGGCHRANLLPLGCSMCVHASSKCRTYNRINCLFAGRVTAEILHVILRFDQRDEHERLGTLLLEQAVEVSTFIVRRGGNFEAVNLDPDLYGPLSFSFSGH